MEHFGLVGFRARNPTKMVRGAFGHVPTCRKCIPDAFRENLFFWPKVGFWVKTGFFGGRGGVFIRKIADFENHDFPGFDQNSKVGEIGT